MRHPNQSIAQTGNFDGREELRAVVADAAWNIAIYAGLCQDCIDLGDDTGAAYFLRKLVAYVRSGIGAFNDLQATNRAIKNAEAKQ